MSNTVAQRARNYAVSRPVQESELFSSLSKYAELVRNISDDSAFKSTAELRAFNNVVDVSLAASTPFVVLRYDGLGGYKGCLFWIEYDAQMDAASITLYCLVIDGSKSQAL